MTITSIYIYYVAGNTAIDLRQVVTAVRDELNTAVGYIRLKKTQDELILIPDWADFFPKWSAVIAPISSGFSRFIADGEPFQVYNGVDHDQYQVVEP